MTFVRKRAGGDFAQAADRHRSKVYMGFDVNSRHFRSPDRWWLVSTERDRPLQWPSRGRCCLLRNLHPSQQSTGFTGVVAEIVKMRCLASVFGRPDQAKRCSGRCPTNCRNSLRSVRPTEIRDCTPTCCKQPSGLRSIVDADNRFTENQLGSADGCCCVMQ